eukprot:CAMPEP_0196574486 /NCGR_PEP_ID=MMETSP1081-20130531/4186_1 /TAXON_ID=36882 /ORGANISM="Pyramimonas amylifera, Strain CCMP720" /LENGTH=212 /DNA_ID=CAMNT_0041892515 /DNA_START=95 /DNA_END=733 /DNA_ORIENTATION=-
MTWPLMWTMLFLSWHLCGVRGWSSTTDMIQAHYLLVGRYMQQHFDKAWVLASAVRAEYEHALKLRGQAAADHVLQTKATYGDDLATIVGNYLGKADQFFSDGHPQTGVAVLMELTKMTAPRDPSSLRCCSFQKQLNHLLNFWQRILQPGGVLRSYSSARQHVKDLEVSGVDLNVLMHRFTKLRNTLQDYNPESASNIQDVMDTVTRLLQFRD